MHRLATLALLGALALNVRLSQLWWERRRYAKWLETRLIEYRLKELQHLSENLGRVTREKQEADKARRETWKRQTVEQDEAQAHLLHLMNETGLTETELREHLAEKGMKPEDVDVIRLTRLFGVPTKVLQSLMGGNLSDKCPGCGKAHPPFGSEATDPTEERASGRPIS